MPVSMDDFWKLAEASELLSPGQCAELRGEFAGLKGAAQQANTRSLAQWLVATGRLTRYQAALLASGRPGPFVFGPFVVTECIENGRLAQTFRATYNSNNKVLLVFLSQLTDEPSQYARLVELAQAAAAVKNPHASRTYRAVRQRSQTFIVVEGLEGESLGERLAQQKVAPQEACRLGFQAALGLVAMHAENLVHGAVCPANIWVDPAGTAKLLQFPLVPTEGNLRRREPPLVDYLAPELIDGQQRADALADIYGLGCTLFELIAGRVPFPGGTPQQRLARHRSEFPQRLDEIDPRIPEELADLVSDMLAKDRMLRCQNASHVAHLLAPLATGSSRQPPKLNPTALAPGYGAWKAPEWQAPPQQSRPAGKSPPRPTAAPQAEPSRAAAASDLQVDDEHSAPPAGGAASDEPSESESVAPAIVINAADDQSSSGESAAPEVPFVVTANPGTTTIRPTRKRTSQTALVGFGVGLAAVVALIGIAIIQQRGDTTTTATPNEGTNASADDSAEAPKSETQDALGPTPEETSESASEPGNLAFREVDDDGQTLWAPPTVGEPLSAAYLPNGAQVLVVVRPAELLSTAEGAKLLDALGPGGRWVESHLRATLGIEPSQIKQLTVAFAPDAQSVPQATYVAHLASEVAPETLLAAWGKPAAAEHQGKKYLQGPRHAYYLPKDDPRVVVVAPTDTMKQILELDGQPLLRGSVEKLLAHSDAARHVNVLFTPSYLLTDGQSLLVGELAQLRAPLREFLDESIEAVLVSAHVGQQLYVEFRAIAPVDRAPLELLELLRGRWEKMPEWVETHVASLEPHPYGRLVVNRFPRMMQLARDFTRGGVDDDEVVLNAYLPQAAAHNLVMGTELTLLESLGTAAAPVETAAPAAPRSAAEILRKKISLSFPRDSLDRVMNVMADELGVEIVILGSDLQLEGITKNQSLNNVDERDQPADEILRRLLKMANSDGKLVYVIKPNDQGRETIFITTRAAVEKRGEKLPDGF